MKIQLSFSYILVLSMLPTTHSNTQNILRELRLPQEKEFNYIKADYSFQRESEHFLLASYSLFEETNPKPTNQKLGLANSNFTKHSTSI